MTSASLGVAVRRTGIVRPARRPRAIAPRLDPRLQLRGEPRLSLSTRELEALQRYAVAGTQKDVAVGMGIQPQAVKNHLQAAYRKLGVTSALEAFSLLGWLRPVAVTDWHIGLARARLLALRDEIDALISLVDDSTPAIEVPAP